MTITPAETPPRGLRLRLPIISTLIPIALFGVWYYLASRQRTDYYIGRNLRLLATITSEINDKLTTERGFIKNFADMDSWCESDSASRPVTQYSRDTASPESKRFGDNYLPGFEHAERSTAPPPDARPGFGTKFIERDGRLWLATSYLGKKPEGLAPDVQPNGQHIAPLPRCPLGYPRWATGEIDLRSVIEPVLQQRLLTDFDTILLARSDGSVVVRVTPGAIRASTPLDIVNVASLREQKTPFSADVPIPLAELQHHTRYADVTIGRTDYVFFSQPYMYDMPKDAGQWFVCALMPRERFRHNVLTISPSLVLLIAAAILLAFCGWPFLKLALINDKNAVTLADAILLLVGILFGTGILTLMFADVFSYRRLRAIDDYQNRSFALSMKTDLLHEIGQTIGAAHDLIRWSTTRNWQYRSLGDLGLDGLHHNQQNKKTHETYLDSETYPHVYNYPFFTEFAFIDRTGQQRYHGVMKGIPAPLISVADRSYFTEVKTHPWVWNEDDGPTRYYIQSVRSGATGKSEAVLSILLTAARGATPSPGAHRSAPADNPLPVFTITFPALDVDGRLCPPDYGFAVIDDSGNVIFHDDDTRNGVENFFTETDDNRALRSAVLAHEERFVDTSYLDQHCRVRVTPIEGTPWTLLTISHRRVLRAVNAEGALISLTALAVWLLLILTFVAAVMVARPRYRAPWLWPDIGRGAEWARLRIVLVMTAAAFAGTVYYLLPAASAIAAILVPPQAIAATYLVLRRRKWSGMTMAVGATWVALTALWIVLIARSGIHPDLLQPGSRAVAEAGLIVAIVAGAIVTLFRHHPFAPPRHYARAYVTCGVLVVVVIAVLPTLAIFQSTYRSEVEAMVRFGQLGLALDLERRLDSLADQNWSNEPAVALSYVIPFFYQSLWCVEPPPGGAGWCPCGKQSTAAVKLASIDRTNHFDSGDDAFTALLDGMPSYSEDTFRLRAFLRASSADRTWRSWRSHRVSALTHYLQLGQTNAPKTIDLNDHNENNLTHLTVVSRFPWLLTFDAKQPDPITPYPVWRKDINAYLSPIPRPAQNLFGARAGHFLGYAIAALSVIFLVFAAVAFIARKVLLLDIALGPTLKAGTKLDDKLQENIFIVGFGDASVYANVKDFCRIQFRELAEQSSWSDELARIEKSNQPRVLCEGADYRMDNGDVTRHKLSFLERLLESPNRSVVIVSAVAVPAIVAESPYKERWLSVLTNFTWIHEGAFAAANESASVKDALVFPFTRRYWREIAEDVGDWVKGLKNRGDVTDEVAKQANVTPLLSGIHVADDTSREFTRAVAAQISDAVADRTDRFYAALWNTFSSFERLALLQVAQHGFVNGDNRRIIRHLLGRGVIRRTPEVRLFNDSFRPFVIAQAADVDRECRDILPTTTTWDKVRSPLLSTLVIVTAVFLGTQKDLLNVMTGVASALAVGYPAIAKLIGSVTGRRAAAAAE